MVNNVQLTPLEALGVAIKAEIEAAETYERLAHLVRHPTPQMLECSRLLRQADALKQRKEHAALLLSRLEDYAWAAFLADLARRLPEEAWLERVAVEAKGRCLIEGVALTQDAAYSLAESLRSCSHVDTARMGGTGTRREGQLILSWFRVEVTLAAITTAKTKEGQPDRKP